MSSPIRFNDPLGLVYGDGALQFEDVLFGPTYWMREHFGMDAALPQGLVDGAAGFGDGLTASGTVMVRDWMGVDGAVNRCSSIYQGSEWAGVGAGLALPIGRVAYIGKVGALPHSGMALERIFAQRNALKAYFRGRPLDQILPALNSRFGYQTVEQILARNGGDVARAIARSGGTSFGWSAGIIGFGSAKSGIAAGIANSDDCICSSR